MDALGRDVKEALDAKGLIGEFVGQHGHVPASGPESQAFLAEVAQKHGRAVRDYAAGLLLHAGLVAGGGRPRGCKLGEVPVDLFLQAVCNSANQGKFHAFEITWAGAKSVKSYLTAAGYNTSGDGWEVKPLKTYWTSHVKPYMQGNPPSDRKVNIANYNLWMKWAKGGIRPNTPEEEVTNAEGLTRRTPNQSKAK